MFFLIFLAYFYSFAVYSNSEDFSFTLSNKKFVSDIYQKTKIGFICNEDILSSEIWNNVKKALEGGKQIAFVPVKKSFTFSITGSESLQLLDKNILFTLIVFEKNNAFAWKLIDNQSNKTIAQKEYSVDACSKHAIKKICGDIWKELFGFPTPFSHDLLYIKSCKKRNQTFSSICKSSPFISAFSPEVILKSNRPIYDLAVFSAFGQLSLVYAEPTTHNVRIMCMNHNGVIYPLINIPGTLNCFSQCDSNSAFYVNSGDIYLYEYDSSKHCIVHTPLLHKSTTCSNPIYIGGNRVLYVRNSHIYICNFDSSAKQFKNHTRFIEKASIAPSYCQRTNMICFCQKIDGYMQIILKDIGTGSEHILTSTKYNKADPAFSPCGNYIAYIASSLKGLIQRHIEVVNVYTGHTIYIESDVHDLSYPCWA